VGTGVNFNKLRSRDIRLDALKGMAIALVVVGHVIQYSHPTTFDSSRIFRFIYSFHMPLFMFISGYIAAYTQIEKRPFLRKKFLGLVVPFLVWYGISYFILPANHHIAPYTYWSNLFVSPDYGLWFLWVLFLNFVMLAIALKNLKRLGPAVFPLTILLMNLIPYNVLGLILLRWHAPFFFAGYVIMRYRHVFMKYRPVALAGTVAFLPLALTWHRNYIPYPLVVFLNHYFNSSVQLAPLTPFIILVYRYGVAFCGIAASFWLINAIPKTVVTKVLGWLGQNSLGIYATQVYFLGLGVGVGHILIITRTLAVLALAVISTVALKQFGLTNAILLGVPFSKANASGIAAFKAAKNSGFTQRLLLKRAVKPA
jgi:fucose 4-O-acetylase-like acetyltransferase